MCRKLLATDLLKYMRHTIIPDGECQEENGECQEDDGECQEDDGERQEDKCTTPFREAIRILPGKISLGPHACCENFSSGKL